MSPNNINHKTIAGFPRNTFIFICCLAAIAGAVSWFHLFYRPPQSPVITPTFISTPRTNASKVPKPILPDNVIRPLNISNVSLDAHPNLPSSFPLLVASPSSPLRSLADQIATKLKMSPSRSLLSELTWKNNLATLIANTDNRSLTYFLNSPVTPTTNTTPDPLKSSLVAQNLLKSLNLWQNNISLNDNATVFLQAQGPDLKPVKRPQNADSLLLNYQYLIDNIPVIISTQENPVSVQVINNSQVANFVVFLSASTTKKDTYPLIALEQVTSLIQDQTARLISVHPQDYINPTTSTEISSFSINSLQIAYYYSPTQNLLYPAYLAKGEGKFSDSTKDNLTFLLPAIDPKYYE